MLYDEYKWFEENRDILFADYYGRYVVVKGGAVIADYATFDEAYSDMNTKDEPEGTYLIHRCVREDEEEVAEFANLNVSFPQAVMIC